jgi:hypothetical protein
MVLVLLTSSLSFSDFVIIHFIGFFVYEKCSPGLTHKKSLAAFSIPSFLFLHRGALLHGWVDQKSYFIIPVRLRAFVGTLFELSVKY